ncbi:hypothetical protein TCAL_01824 [Tigriopus californicus]|uniref:C-type lectin domain-containing protein n=1 Tax=Tigriopus californicus TaxID=6832 RepID=A0A553NCY9_TIGCA|nr:C-type lectin domain family 4 member F-like [Tigriopus californicus]TRY63316.1 hypothetical protein TCAL_01824 [Tigriopus californicus]
MTSGLSFLLLSFAHNTFASTLVLSPTLTKAQNWESLEQEQNVPLVCVLKCRSTNCPGVAFDPEEGMCLYGSYHSNPSNAGESFVEVWMVESAEKYEVKENSQSVLLPRNYCQFYPDWVKKSNGKAYKFSSQAKTWQECQTHCHAQGGQMIVVTTKEEENILFELSGYHETWIGLTNPYGIVCYDDTCDGQTIWNDGTRFRYDTAIYSKRFEFNEGSYCIRTRSSEYNDRHCQIGMATLCEITCF